MTTSTPYADAFNKMLGMYPVEELEPLVVDNDDFETIHSALMGWLMTTVPGVTVVKANALAYLAQVIYAMGYDYRIESEQLKEMWSDESQ